MDNKNKLSNEELRKEVEAAANMIINNISRDDNRCMVLLVDDGDVTSRALAGTTVDICNVLMKCYIAYESFRKIFSKVAKAIISFELLGPDGIKKLVSKLEDNVAKEKMVSNNIKAEA